VSEWGVQEAADKIGGGPPCQWDTTHLRKDRLRARTHARNLASRQWLELRAWQTSLEKPMFVGGGARALTRPFDSPLEDSDDQWSSANTVVERGDLDSPLWSSRRRPRSLAARTQSWELGEVVGKDMVSHPPIRRTKSSTSQVRWPDEEDAQGKLSHEILFQKVPSAESTCAAWRSSSDAASAASKKGGFGVFSQWLGKVTRGMSIRRLSLSGTRPRQETRAGRPRVGRLGAGAEQTVCPQSPSVHF